MVLVLTFGVVLLITVALSGLLHPGAGPQPVGGGPGPGDRGDAEASTE
jgi:hypothetical protein